jgi:hypothetical protein
MSSNGKKSKKEIEKHLTELLKNAPKFNPEKISPDECRDFFQYKISKNMKEYELGRWKSRKQAIAVSYSETEHIYPKCHKTLSKKK